MSRAPTGFRTRSYGKFPKESVKTWNRYCLDHESGKPVGTCTKPSEAHLEFSYADNYDYTVMTDVVTPNFRRRIKAGELILNPMSWSRVAYSAADGFSFSCVLGSDPNDCYLKTATGSGSMNYSWRMIAASMGPDCPLLDPMVESDEQTVLNAMAAVDPTAFNVMEDVLQLRQFAESIAHPISSMRDIAKQYANAKTRARSMANAWAKYRFEFLPLLGTAEALIRTAIGPATRLEKGVRLRATAVTSGSDRKKGQCWDKTNVCEWSYNNHRVVRKRAVVFYTLSRVHTGLGQNLGTRFKDLPTGLWNTVTLSFMIDRLINISTFITAVSNLCDPDIHVEGGCLTVWDYTYTESQLLRFRQHDGYVLVDTKPVVAKADTCNRTVVNPIAIAANPLSMDFRPIGLVSDMNRVLDLLAITIQKLKL